MGNMQDLELECNERIISFIRMEEINMLYVIKRLSDSYYLSSLEESGAIITQFICTPIQTDALKLPQNSAERYSNMLNKIENNIYKVVPATKTKEI